MEKIKYQLSYENSKRLLELSEKMHFSIDKMIQERNFRDSYGKIVSEVNRKIFELAESQGVSVYDICYKYMPVEKNINIKFLDEGGSIQGDIELVPIVFEFEKGGGYWKDKYYRLKEKLKNIVDNKND